jgi:hypothetical protein
VQFRDNTVTRIVHTADVSVTTLNGDVVNVASRWFYRARELREDRATALAVHFSVYPPGGARRAYRRRSDAGLLSESL